MALFFSPDGTLNVAWDPSDLPEQAGDAGIQSGAMVRCKNLDLSRKGIAKTRKGSVTLNASAIDTDISWIEVQSGIRYTFAGTSIYENETAIETGLTAGTWSAIQYNAYNDPTPNIFALNGTERVRIENGAVEQWGIAAPTIAPVLAVGSGTGLTGEYNARYTYVRKVGAVVVAESDPSPVGTSVVLANQSLAATITQPTDPQVTHVRLYRTAAGADSYFLDDEIEVAAAYVVGVTYDWEESDQYFVGNANKFTTSSDVATTSGLVYIASAISYDFSLTTATAAYKLAATGIAYAVNPPGAYQAISGQWLVSGSVSDYQVKATVVSGDTPTTGTVDSWQSLSSDAEWTLVSAAGEVWSDLEVSIRLAATSEVLVTAPVTLWANGGFSYGVPP